MGGHGVRRADLTASAPGNRCGSERAMTEARQRRVVERHPKGKPEGHEERRAQLADALGVSVPSWDEARALARPAARDDVLDKIVAEWTARRWAEEKFGQLPPFRRCGGPSDGDRLQIEGIRDRKFPLSLLLRARLT